MLRTRILPAFVVLAFAIAAPAVAADKKEDKKKTEASAEKGINGIVVVDIQQLEAESNAAKKLKEKLKSKREKFQKEIMAEEKKLRDEQQKIIDQKDELEPEEFKKKAQAFEKGLISAQQKIQEKKVEFDKSVGEALSKLRTEVVRVVGNLATENNYKLVVTRQNVVIVEKNVDITNEALARMNKDVKDIPLN